MSNTVGMAQRARSRQAAQPPNCKQRLAARIKQLRTSTGSTALALGVIALSPIVLVGIGLSWAAVPFQNARKRRAKRALKQAKQDASRIAEHRPQKRHS